MKQIELVLEGFDAAKQSIKNVGGRNAHVKTLLETMERDLLAFSRIAETNNGVMRRNIQTNMTPSGNTIGATNNWPNITKMVVFDESSGPADGGEFDSHSSNNMISPRKVPTPLISDQESQLIH